MDEEVAQSEIIKYNIYTIISSHKIWVVPGIVEIPRLKLHFFTKYKRIACHIKSLEVLWPGFMYIVDKKNIINKTPRGHRITDTQSFKFKLTNRIGMKIKSFNKSVFSEILFLNDWMITR